MVRVYLIEPVTQGRYAKKFPYGKFFVCKPNEP